MDDAKWEPISDGWDQGQYETTLAALNTAETGESKGMELVGKCTLGVKNNAYHNAATEHKQKQIDLQNAGWGILNMLEDYSTLHSMATYAWDQIVGNRHSLIQEQINISINKPFYVQEGFALCYKEQTLQ